MQGKRVNRMPRLTPGRTAGVVAAVVVLVGLAPEERAAGAQTASFEETIGDLGSKESSVRLRAARMLKAAAYPESAAPLARVLADADDEVQLEAVAGELNIFLAEKVTPSRRIGFVVEVRGRIAAEPLFTAGPSVVGPLRVPIEVPVALAAASVDRNPRVSVEALYAFGVLAGEVSPGDRQALLARTASLLAGIVGAPDPVLRLAAVRVIGRVYAPRPGDPVLGETVGDAVISVLNDREDAIRETAMWALGSLRYERSVQALIQLFQHYRKGPLAERALDALSRVGHDAGLPLLVEHLHSKDSRLKLIAIEGLGRAGDRSRAETLPTQLATERSESMQLAGQFARAMLSDGSLDPIIGALGRSRVRYAALGYLSELAAGRASQFVRHAQSPEAAIRRDVADVLGLSGDVTALSVVEPLASDHDPEVALAGRRAVARLRPASAPAP